MFCRRFTLPPGRGSPPLPPYGGGREVSKPEVVRTEFTAYGLSFGFAVGWSKVTPTWHYRTVTQSSLVTAFQKTTTAPGPHTRTGPPRFFVCSVLAVKSHQLQFQPNKVTRRKVTKKNNKKRRCPPTAGIIKLCNFHRPS